MSHIVRPSPLSSFVITECAILTVSARTQTATPTMTTVLDANAQIAAAMTMVNLGCDLNCDDTLASTGRRRGSTRTPSTTADRKFATSVGFLNANVSNEFANLTPNGRVGGPRKTIFKPRTKPRAAAVAATKEVEANYNSLHALQMEMIARDAEDLANAPDAAPDARRTADELRTAAMAARVRAAASVALAQQAAVYARARGSVFTTVKNSGDAFAIAMVADLDHHVATIEEKHVATIVAKLSRAGVETVDPVTGPVTARLMGELLESAKVHANMTGIARNMSVKAAEMVEMAEQNPNEAAHEMATGALEMASDGRKMVDTAFDIKNHKMLEFATNLHETYPAANNFTPEMVARKLFCDDAPVQARHVKVFKPDQSFAATFKVPRQFSFAIYDVPRQFSFKTGD